MRGFDLARNPGLSNNTEFGAVEFPLPVRRLGVPECHISQGDEKTTQEVERTIHDHGKTPAGTVLPYEYGASSPL